RQALPPRAHVMEVLEALEEEVGGLKLAQLEGRLNLSHSRIEQTLKILTSETPAPVVKQGTAYHRTTVKYEYDEPMVAALAEVRRREQRRMQDYMACSGCLMEFLASELDDPDAAPCGRCANCVGNALVPVDVDFTLVNEANTFLRRLHLVIEPRKQWPADGLPGYEFRKKVAPFECRPGRAL